MGTKAAGSIARTHHSIPGGRPALLILCLLATMAAFMALGSQAQAAGNPDITGTPMAGEVLKANTSGISDTQGIADGTFTYQWMTSSGGTDTDIAGADGPSYIPDDGDIGRRIKVKVSYTDSANNQEGPATSAATGPVSRNPDGPVIWSGTVTAAALGTDKVGYASGDGATPHNSAITKYLPGGTGGSVSPNAFSYRDSGQFNVRFVLTHERNDLPNLITVKLDNSNQGGIWPNMTIITADDPEPDADGRWIWESRYLRFLKPIGQHHWSTGQKTAVALRVNNHPGNGRPTISGHTQIGQYLTAYPTGITDFNGLPAGNSNYTYQWLRQDGDAHTPIPGATSQTIGLTADDDDHTFKVQVSYTDQDGFAGGPFTSNPTRAISNPSGNRRTNPSVPDMLPPPEHFHAGVSRQHTLRFTWTSHPDTAAHRVEWRNRDDDGRDWSMATVAGPTQARTLTDLDCNTTYEIRITSRKNNQTYYGPYDTLFMTTTLCPQALRVTDLQINHRNNCANLTWVGATHRNVNGYRVGRFTIGADSVVLVNQSSNSARSHSDCSYEYRTPGSSSSFWVAAIYKYGNYELRRMYTSQYIYSPQTRGHISSSDEGNGDSGDSQSSNTNNAAARQPDIAGTAKVGETLTAGTSSITDDDGLDNVSYQYQWLRDDADIAGQTNSTYDLVSADEGKTIKVRVTFNDDAGNAESLTSAATTAVLARPTPTVLLTASFANVAADHNGDSFTFQLIFSENVEAGYARIRNHAFTVDGATIDSASRTTQGSNQGWNVEVKPTGNGSVTITLPETTDCTDSGAICTDDSRKLSHPTSATVAGPPAISVGDATAQEAEGAVLEFTVSLGHASSRTVTVAYATSDGTATSGSDYTATSGTLTFNAGDTSQTVQVAVLTDSDDEDAETLTLTLSNPAQAKLDDHVGTGTIEDAEASSETADDPPADDPPAETPVVALTASITNMPATHNGSTFTFDLSFSENVKAGYERIRDDAFTISGGDVKNAQRKAQGSNQSWTITVEPDGNGRISITLPETTDCDATGAICTYDGRKLSNSTPASIPGPE